ncbi:MAG TPA: sigma-54 dependent transcriptional regulator [bacterium]|nr:sigma-54 dependent transcriptional regulator [bacterium]HPN42099.1 sigma-54 dependent transcriptional regulator [bacterium]
MLDSILIIEDNPAVKDLYINLFQNDCANISIQNDINRIPELITENPEIECVLLNSNSLQNARDSIVSHIKAIRSDIIIIVTGPLPTDTLIQYIKFGVDDYFDNPAANPEELRNTIHSLHQRKENERAVVYHKEINPLGRETGSFLGNSAAVLDLKKLAIKAAPIDATILITGETGTGKEVLARMIHAGSPVKYHEFIAVHCGGIPDTLLESALFGHEKGAFTGACKEHKGYFEIAGQGTIFLDEIGDTSPAMQIKLLRILQDKTFRRVGGNDTLKSGARVIAATHRNLLKMVEKNKFRRDLYYRLNVISLHIPPLRERPEDIQLLIRHFVQLYSKKHNHLGVYLKPETIELLTRYTWPGNVRELEHVIERLVALTDTDWIGPTELPQEYSTVNHRHIITENVPPLPYPEAKKLFELNYLDQLLQSAGGNMTRAAEIAKMPRQNLYLKINKHKIDTRIYSPIKPDTDTPIKV